jgi:hypothetical protein
VRPAHTELPIGVAWGQGTALGRPRRIRRSAQVEHKQNVHTE